MGPAARARRSSRRSCARTPTTSGWTRSCSWRSTSSASSARGRRTCCRSRRSAAAGGSGARRVIPPFVLVAVCIVALLGVLLALGLLDRRRRRRAGDRRRRRSPRRRRRPTARQEEGQEEEGRADARLGCAIVPTGTVNVCLVDGSGKVLIPSSNLGAGAPTRTFRGKRFRVTFGNGFARDARRRSGRSTCRTATSPSATTCALGKAPRELSGRPAAHLRPVSARAGIVVTGTEVLSGIISDRNGPWLSERLRERGRRPRADHDRRRPPGGHARGAGGAGLARRRPDHHLGGLGPDRGRPDGRGRGRVRRARDGARRGAGGADLGDPPGLPAPLGESVRGRRAGGEPQAGRGARRARRCWSRSAPRRGWWCRRRIPGRRCWCCRARRASCSRCGSRRWRRPRCGRRSSGAGSWSAGCCGCSGSRSPRSPGR